jgi:O-antigen/teichoic acid export membrane protein
MSGTVTGNAAANLSARVWSLAIQFLLIPVIVALLGPKAYGLVTLYATLVATLIFLDQGWCTVLVRELPRLSAAGDPDSIQRMNALLRSVETASVSAGVILGSAVALSAPLLVHYWIDTVGMAEQEAINAVRLMGLCLACQWSNGMYASGYVGLHRQGAMAQITAVQVTLATGGTAFLLWKIAPRIEVAFIWQAAIWAAGNLIMRWRLFKLLPAAAQPARFRLEALSAARHFAFGNIIIGLTSALLTQADKIILARFVPLESLAAYNLSFTIASLMLIIIGAPIGSILIPLLARLFATDETWRLADEYHRWTQVMVFLALPAAGIMIFFPQPFLELWLQPSSPLIAPIVQLLPWVALGTLFNIVVRPIASLQLSSGWMRLLILKNLVTLPIFLAALLLLVGRFGPVAGAYCWIGLNVSDYLFMAPLVHRRLLRAELWRWWSIDTLLPALLSFAVFVASERLLSFTASRWLEIGQALATASVAYLLMLALLPYPRALASELLRRLSLIGR